MGGKEKVGQVSGNGKVTFTATLSAYGVFATRRFTKEELLEIARDPKKLEAVEKGGKDVNITSWRLHPDAAGKVGLPSFFTEEREAKNGVTFKSGRKVRITVEWA